MDEQMLTLIIKRLEKIENIIDNNNKNINENYKEIREELSVIKMSVMKIDTEQNNLQRRVTNLEENKKNTNLLVFSGLITAIFSLAVNVIIRLM